jgi:hypothetical protein
MLTTHLERTHRQADDRSYQAVATAFLDPRMDTVAASQLDRRRVGPTNVERVAELLHTHPTSTSDARDKPTRSRPWSPRGS